MTFLALLTKELRLQLRSERTIWVIILYILGMGLLGWTIINSQQQSPLAWTTMGIQLYTTFSYVQIILILLITPAFTASAVNGEKERQTFDLLLCSRLSSWALVGGKLCAGLGNALIVIAASLPLFSLAFFFGGISVTLALQALAIFVVSALVVATFSLLCSTLFRRPAVSTAIAYLAILLWLVGPLVLSAFMLPSRSAGVASTMLTAYSVPAQDVYVYQAPSHPVFQGTMYTWQTPPSSPPLSLIWNPFEALSNTNTGLNNISFSTNTMIASTNNNGIYSIAGLHFPSWLGYIGISLLAMMIFFLLSLWYVKPHSLHRHKQHILHQRETSDIVLT